jgi:phage tail sheath protein FI
MPEYRSPGVYIEEIESGPRPIEGVPTSSAAILGHVERGPVEPRLVTSYQELELLFGCTCEPDEFVPDAVKGFFANGGKRAYICRVVGPNTTSAKRDFGDFIVRAAGPGSWGGRVWATVGPSTTRSSTGNPVGFRVRLAYFAASDVPFDPFTEEGAGKNPRPFPIEDFDDLVVDENAPDFYARRMPFFDEGKGDAEVGTNGSALGILVRKGDVPAHARPADGSGLLAHEGADDDVLDATDFAGRPRGTRTQEQGLAALERDPCREVSLVYAPAASNEIVRALIDHCERMRSRFAVIDAPRNSRAAADLDPRTQLPADSSHAAFYHPWIAISDPKNGARKIVPPGGHVLGVFARSDSERGVFEAPANETLHGALDLAHEIDDQTQEVLNARGVNAIRRFPGRGIRVWGARTISSNEQWKYVSVCRFLIFLERSIYEGTRWVVFEPNDDRLWVQLVDQIRLFLLAQWRLGGLRGRTEQEAFFVRCDHTTMSKDDLIEGRLICEIGVAPVRPAEFVMFRIFHQMADGRR